MTNYLSLATTSLPKRSSIGGVRKLGFTSSFGGTSTQNFPNFRIYAGGEAGGLIGILPSSLAILDLGELPCPVRFCAKSCRGIQVPLLLVVLPWPSQKRRVLLPSDSNSISAELCLFSCRAGTSLHCFSAAVQRACRAYFLDVCKFQAIATAFLHTSVRSLPTRD